MKTYCITTRECAERTALARAHFIDCGIDADFVVGLHGVTSGIMTAHTYDLDRPTGYRLEGKHCTLCIAHQMVWQIALRQDDEFVMVLENDAIFHDGWDARFQQALRDVPEDMSILLLGSGNTGDKPKEFVAGEIWDVRYPDTTHAYVLAKKAIPTLLETQQKIWAPIDIALRVNSYPHLRVFTMLPRLCEQRGQTIAP